MTVDMFTPVTNDSYTADRLRYLFDYELSFNLNRSILFMQFGDRRNACRFIERCIGIAYAAGAVGLYDTPEVWTVICILMKSKVHEGAHMCERCMDDE